MRLLDGLPNNSKICILSEPFWAVFSSIISFYAPLYMKSLFLSELEMGYINMVSMLTGFLFHFFAGIITNRLGRKRTMIVFDLISWSVPMLIWALATNFRHFMAGFVINSLVKVVSVSWFCLISEDAPQHKRASIFGFINLINCTAGILTPVTGLFIAEFGTVPVLRCIYMLGFASMTAMFFVRNAHITETKTGKELMERHCGLTILQSIAIYIRNISYIRKNRGLILIVIIMVLLNFINSMLFYQVLFIKDNLGLNEVVLSFVPFLNAAVNLLVYFLILPAVNGKSNERLLVASFSICLTGSVLFLLCPPCNPAFLFVALVVLSSGSFIMQTYRDAVFLSYVGEYEMADMYGTAQMVSTVLCIPSGYFAGLFFSMNHQLPFFLITALFFCCLVISFFLVNYKSSLNQGKYMK